MTTRPDFGPEYGEEVRESEGVVPQEREPLAEREIEEHEREDRELEYLEPESNEARAPGQICARCGRVITASEDARLLPDGRWMHEVCPPDLSGLSVEGTRPPGGG
jgi:hypothetical protein